MQIAIHSSFGVELDTMREQPPKSLKVTKRDAAVRQITAAIEAFWQGNYDISVTLALAAEGMAEPDGGSLFAKQIADLPPGISRREWIAIVNSERDWLKHPTTDILGEEITIELNVAGYAIARALRRWPEWTPPMSEFKLWYMDYLRKDFVQPQVDEIHRRIDR
ncbi:hypothetical protein ELH72_29715 (plasmid) [Rhizobium ruizarguesonis]|uniref:hypothetical protein n=1 Tax=Rhizobium ruizarguesonis TaxID=2081791 RepID=UPI0010320F8A|nr:hypothetical protein [Rhizobium ruizarguesonis]TAZ71104.1 hypothetical protein ELH72_29715 [Rhizobium ruizarguesonis]